MRCLFCILHVMLKLRRLIIILVNLIIPYVALYTGELIRSEGYIEMPDLFLYAVVIVVFLNQIYRVYRQIRLIYIQDRVIDLGFNFQALFLHVLVAGLFLFFATIKEDEYGDSVINIYHMISLFIFLNGIITGDQNIILNKTNIFFNFLKRTRVDKKSIIAIYTELGFLVIETDKGIQKLQLRNYEKLVKQNFERIRSSIFEIHLPA